MPRLSFFTVVASAVTLCMYISVFLITLELGRGGPERRPATDSVVVISHNFHIAGGVKDFAKKLWETATARESLGYNGVRGRLHTGGAEAAQIVMENRRLGRRSVQQPKQQHPCRPPRGELEESNAAPNKTKRSHQSNPPTTLYSNTPTLQQPRVIRVGPWGGRGGEPFLMRGTASVRHLRGIFVYHSSAVIHALAYDCEYSLAGEEEDAHKRIRRTGPLSGSGLPQYLRSRDVSSAMIGLAAGEYLTVVEGSTGYIGGSLVVTSLTFHTSRGTMYGPFGGSGPEISTLFSVPAASGCIVGFWGRSSRLLDAIGVYITPCAPKITDTTTTRTLETGMKVTVSNKS